MKCTAYIGIIACWAAAAVANTAEVDAAYFHPAASQYIHGNMAAASNLVERGLEEYPDDAKLKRLKDLLRQQQQNQENEQNQQDQQDQQDQQQDQQDQQDQQQEQQQEQNQEDGDQQQEQNQEDGDQRPQQEQQQPPRAEEMSADEAERLLDAMKQEEKNERMELKVYYGAPVDVEKDW